VTEEPTAAAEDLPAGVRQQESPAGVRQQESPAPASAEDAATAADPAIAADPPAPAAASPWDDPRLPWSGKPGRLDVLCWAAITLSGLYYLLLLPFRASLVGTHPVLLVLLNGSTEGIVSVPPSPG